MNNFWVKWSIALAAVVIVGVLAIVFLPAPSSAPVPDTSAMIGKPFTLNGATITVQELLEDSRCAVDVQCLWAGQLVVRAEVSTSDRGYAPQEFTFVLGDAPQQRGPYSIALTGVTPAEKHSGISVPPEEYRFTFSVIKAVSCGGFIQNARTCVTTPSGITFSYASSTYGLATNPQQVLVPAYIPPCDEHFEYCLYRLGDAYEGTNFESAGVRMKNRTDLSTKEACVSTAPAGYVDFHPVVSEHAGYTTIAYGSVGDAGAGHYAQGDLYRVWAGSTCEEFETRIGETQFANYPAGSIRLFTDADRAQVERELREIIDSLMFKGEKLSFPTPTTSTSRGAE